LWDRSNQPAKCGVQTQVELRLSIAALGNLVVIGGLIFYAFALFAEYYSKGRWVKNITLLLAGLGMLVLGFALIITPSSAAAIAQLAHTNAWRLLLVASSTFLLCAIVAFGMITYSRPLRLWHERRIERRLNREVPRIS
jgi:MFS family permease